MLKPQPKKKAWRSEKYRRFVAAMNCCVCNFPGPNDPHHHQEPGEGVMGGKVSDEKCVPLCHCHHMMVTEHGRIKWEDWRRDPQDVITRTQAEWVRRGGKREWE